MDKSIEMSKEVLADLAAQAALEVEGVVSCQQHAVEALASRVKREFVRHGVKVEEEDGRYRLSISICVSYGGKIPEIARKIQEKVKEYVEGSAGVEVEGVEVVVEDIEPPPYSR